MLARMARVILQAQLVVRLWMTPLQLARLRLAHHRPSRRLQQRLASGVVLCCLGWLMLARMARVLWLLMVQLQVVVWPLMMRLQLAQQTLVQAQAWVRPGAQAVAACSGGPGSLLCAPLSFVLWTDGGTTATACLAVWAPLLGAVCFGGHLAWPLRTARSA